MGFALPYSPWLIYSTSGVNGSKSSNSSIKNYLSNEILLLTLKGNVSKGPGCQLFFEQTGLRQILRREWYRFLILFFEWNWRLKIKLNIQLLSYDKFENEKLYKYATKSQKQFLEVKDIFEKRDFCVNC